MAISLLLGADKLDPRHFSAVALAVPHLENACVAALSLRELRTDLAKQLVCRFALVNVTNRETARVQRAALGLGDELLHERTQLLCLCFGSLDSTVLDE